MAKIKFTKEEATVILTWIYTQQELIAPPGVRRKIGQNMPNYRLLDKIANKIILLVEK